MDRTTHQGTYTGLDVGKIVAAILVVTLHTHALGQGSSADFWLSALCRIAVPFFFITSSFLFYKRGGDIRKYVFRILILYAVWFVLEAPLTYNKFFVDTDKSLPYNLALFTRGLLINSTFYVSWFLTASWQGMLLVWWLSKKISSKWLVVIGILCFLSSLPGTMWYGLIAGTPARQPYWLFNMMLCPANSFIVAVPYCIAGKFLAEGRIRFSPRWKGFAALAAALLVCILELAICKDSYWMSDTYLGLLLLSPILVALLSETDVPIGKETSKCLRNLSTLIYLCHWPFMFFISKALGQSSGWRLYLLTLAASIVFSVLVYLLSKRIKALRYLY